MSFPSIFNRYAAALFCLSALQTAVLAQTTPPASPAPAGLPDPSVELRRQQERESQDRKRLETTPEVRPTPAAVKEIERLPTGESPCLTIEQINIEGDGVQGRDWTWLLDSLAGVKGDDTPFGRCLGAGSINLLLKRGQNALVAKGFITSRLLAQEQDLKTGKLTLNLVLGRIRNIRFASADPKTAQANKAVSASVSTPISPPVSLNALPAQPGDILNLRDIEQALENFKRVPTAEADIKIEPGAAPGESDLVIEWKQVKPVRFSASLDDSGSDTTGKRQASVTLSYDNPFGLNDLFYVTLNHDAGGGEGASPKGTQGATLHYSLPYGYWNLSTTASYNTYKQTVIGAYEDYLYSGKSSNMEVKLSRIVYRDAANKTTVSGRLYRRASSNFIDDTEVEVQRRVTSGVELAAAHRIFWGTATVDGQIAYKQGLKILGALAAPEEEFNEGTSQFKMLTADLSISAPFKLAEQKFRLDSSLKLQNNLTPLIPQDRFSIGSRYSVRGFDGKTSLAAEKGLFLQNTVSWTIPGVPSELYLGIDYGKLSGPATEYLVGNALVGSVLGVRGNFQGLSFDVFVGRPLRKPAELEVGNVYGFSLNYSY